ncbi:MAG: helix-turn-helix transcriptional regulator [Brevundimonas sp.]|uniref:helix-turn-helix domain-containing protein n=1 Tax=Brevundimonas sp. TaxID=1871086 RepID=UPI002614CC2E|nr:helix-turn-helix transcriptional regulator [Brevundimonas sp.]MDI6624107.1 helix-turn-helix transcriptional regulator [Brevundimonas sp.]MDQ7812858.1 helix-turn-helix transcriptional regulator [Brevundimonas sp.]
MTTRRKSDGAAEARNNRLLGQRIALARSARGLTLAELAAAIGGGHQLIQRYETGEMAVPFGRLVQIAQALEMPLSALIGDAFDDGSIEDPETRIVLQIARMTGRLPPAKRAVLVALARELGRP